MIPQRYISAGLLSLIAQEDERNLLALAHHHAIAAPLVPVYILAQQCIMAGIDFARLDQRQKIELVHRAIHDAARLPEVPPDCSLATVELSILLGRAALSHRTPYSFARDGYMISCVQLRLAYLRRPPTRDGAL